MGYREGMNQDLPDPAAVREALRRLGNPYAKLEIDEDSAQLKPELRPLAEAQLANVRRTENPYASLSVADAGEEPVQQRSVSVPRVRGGVAPKTTISQRDFEAECRRIFRQYIPSAEKGKIRPHHREFIVRNRPRPSHVRYRLVEGLREYDLSDIPGFEVLYNREREELTAQKLTKIERAVIAEEA